MQSDCEVFRGIARKGSIIDQSNRLFLFDAQIVSREQSSMHRFSLPIVLVRKLSRGKIYNIKSRCDAEKNFIRSINLLVRKCMRIQLIYI